MSLGRLSFKMKLFVQFVMAYLTVCLTGFHVNARRFCEVN